MIVGNKLYISGSFFKGYNLTLVFTNIHMMRLRLFTLVLLIFGIFPTLIGQKTKNNTNKADVPINLQTQLDSVSYALGIYLADNLQQQGFEQINPALFAAGLKDVQTSQRPIFETKMANEIIGKYVMNQRKAKASKNLEDGKLFLEKNKSVNGVVTLPSGLQYEVIKEGTGNKPTIDDKVTVNYNGTLLSGKVFDSSIDRGKPVQLKIDQVIEGWKEALPLMSVGSKWKLFIPSDLAYGENPQPGSPIEPNALLIFEVELVSIDKDQPESQQPIPDNTTNQK